MIKSYPIDKSSTHLGYLIMLSIFTRMRHPRAIMLIVVSFMMSLIALPSVQAAPVAPFLDQLVVNGLNFPTGMTFSPDGRLFVIERGGDIHIIDNGVLQAAPFMTIPPASIHVANERGLISLAFDPNYLSNGFFYITYTTNTPTLHNRISRFTANGVPATATSANFASEQILLDIDDIIPANQLNNTGTLAFGPDGFLYIATGDNERYTNPADIAAQDATNLLGSVLRITTTGAPAPGNPNFGGGSRPELWAIGLRNPYMLSFQPTTGLLYINDVGDGAWEEISQGVAGANYGWPYREADDPGPMIASEPIGFVYNSPLAPPTYPNTGFPNDCAVTGGTFNNGTQFPGFENHYFFSDFCAGFIRAYNPTTPATPAINFATALGFGVIDLDMSLTTDLYYLTFGGEVHRIYNPNPMIIQHPSDVTVTEGQSASFSCSATGQAPLAYQWERDGVAITGATATTYTIASTTLADSGATFRCRVSSAGFPDAVSNTALLTVNPPTVSLFDPAISKLGFLQPGQLGAQNEVIEWVVTVSNPSGVRGNNVVITDTLRPELRIDRVDAPNASVNISGQTVTVTYATLVSGQSVRFSIFTTVISGGAQLDNTACVSADNIRDVECVTAPAIQSLPSTGETPWWRVWVLVSMVMMILLIFGALGLLMVLDVAMPLTNNHPDRWA